MYKVTFFKDYFVFLYLNIMALPLLMVELNPNLPILIFSFLQKFLFTVF